jgi:hypothetical protein
MSVKEALKARMEQHINEMVSTNPMIGQLNTQFTSWLLGSGLTGNTNHQDDRFEYGCSHTS